MDMKIQAELIKELRSKKSWSQEHLASVSGLSLRTIQRIENSGACSLESKKSLASVFGLDSAELEFKELDSETNSYQGNMYGYYGVVLGLVCAYSGITYSVLNNSISYSSPGIYYGSIGAFCGICCGIIGYLSKDKKA